MKLILDNDEVQCIDNDGLIWSIPTNELVFIGEYTTSAGPWFDDWFYLFASKLDTWYQVPFEAELKGDSQFWTQLGEKLNCVIAPGLINSTVWASNVIYPKYLEGEQLFTVVRSLGKPKTIWQRIFTGNSEEKVELTDQLKALFVKN